MNRPKTSETTCQVCNQTLKKLTDSHLKKHGLTLNEYKILYGDADGRYKQCAHVHKFTGHPCQLWVSPDSDDPFCILHSRDNGKDARLFEKIFRGLLDFYIKHKKDMHFEEIIFPIDIILTEMIFETDVYFNDCQFLGKLSFWRSQFLKKVNFRGCFFQDANFNLTEFQRQVYFSGSTFQGRARFVDTNFNIDSSYIRLINVHFEDPDEVIFRENNFSRVLFRDTNLAGVSIENAKWPKTSRFRGNRRALSDEIYYDKEARYELSYRCLLKLKEEGVDVSVIDKLKKMSVKKFASKREFLKHLKDHLSPQELTEHTKLILRSAHYYNTMNRIRITYQQLKHNFEEKKSSVEAGNFYYGEIECYRKSSLFRRYFPFNMVNLYRISSGYGQRYIRAGVVLVLLLVLFSISHMFLGLEPSPHNRDYQKIDYDVASLASINTSIPADFYISTVYCVEVLTREQEPDRIFQPLTTNGDAINSLFTILIYIQVVFFTLALRRHFKR